MSSSSSASSRLSIVWIRRNMRIEDNKVIHEALRNSDSILPIFVFDTTILSRFTNKQDRRLSFIANIIDGLNTELQKYNGELTVFHGDPVKIVPKLAKFLDAYNVYADEDYEPENVERDEKVKAGLTKNQSSCDLELHCDHVLLRPDIIVKNDNTPFRKFTPYMKVYKQYLADNQDEAMVKYTYQLKDKIADVDLSKAGLNIIDLSQSPSHILDQIGYEYQEDEMWHPTFAKKVLNNFIQKKIKDYKEQRNFMAADGTSRISPYLRFGVISIRELFSQAYPFKRTIGGDQWLNELIWREFYVAILFHFPETATLEFLEKYRNKIKWDHNEEHYQRFITGQTGFPIIDASIRQLLQEGWMHNRSRMIVANFLTKNLFIDWKTGEEFFAQHLMDYDLSSNVGGWQWSSSVGTDAQPYFRVFSPFRQSAKYDPDCEYIKKYCPELKNVTPKSIHDGDDLSKQVKSYPAPIVNYDETRKYAVDYFRKIT